MSPFVVIITDSCCGVMHILRDACLVGDCAKFALAEVIVEGASCFADVW